MVKLDSFCLSMNRDMTITFPLEINNMDITDYEVCEPRIIIKLEKSKLNLLYKGSVDKNDKMVFRIPALPFNAVLDNTAMMCVELIVGEQIFKLMNGVIDIDKTEVKAGQMDIKYDNDSASETDKQYQDKLSGDPEELMGLEDEDELYGDPGSEPMSPSVKMGKPQAEVDAASIEFKDVFYSNELESDEDETTLDDESNDSSTLGLDDLNLDGLKDSSPSKDDDIQTLEDDEPSDDEDNIAPIDDEEEDESANEKWFYTPKDILAEEEKRKFAQKLKFSLPYAGSFLSTYATGGAGDDDSDPSNDFYSSDVTNVDGGIGDGGGGVGEKDYSDFDDSEELNSEEDQSMARTLAKVLKAETDLTIAKTGCGPEMSDNEVNKYGVNNKDGYYSNECDECDDDEDTDGVTAIKNYYNADPQLPTVSMPPPKNKFYYTLDELKNIKKLA